MNHPTPTAHKHHSPTQARPTERCQWGKGTLTNGWLTCSTTDQDPQWAALLQTAAQQLADQLPFDNRWQHYIHDLLTSSQPTLQGPQGLLHTTTELLRTAVRLTGPPNSNLLHTHLKQLLERRIWPHMTDRGWPNHQCDDDRYVMFRPGLNDPLTTHNGLQARLLLHRNWLRWHNGILLTRLHRHVAAALMAENTCAETWAFSHPKDGDTPELLQTAAALLHTRPSLRVQPRKASTTINAARTALTTP